MTQIYCSAFDDLPPDQYGVLLANERDAIRLKWLVSTIGETKLRRSVAKYSIRYPESQPFVSVILGWYHLKVPARLYSAVPVPVYWVYILRLRERAVMKVGMTGRWPQRAWDFVRKENEPTPDWSRLGMTFDLLASRAWLIGGNKIEAKRREDALLEMLSPWKVAPPWKDGLTNYGAAGHSEWFDATHLPAAAALAASFGRRGDAVPSVGQSLADALHVELSTRG